jgi:hypothetical protein
VIDEMTVETLTTVRLQHLKPPREGVFELWDTLSRGLCLRVFKSGRATWCLCYRPQRGGGRRRFGLGSFPTVGLAEARRRADRHRGKISDGADPQAERRAARNAPTLAEVIELYLAEITPKKKLRTIELYSHYLRKLIGEGLRARKAETITRADVAYLHRELGQTTRVTANRVLVSLSGVYNFAGRHGLVYDGFNPAPTSTNSRSSFVSAACRATSSPGLARCCAWRKPRGWRGLSRRAGRRRGTIASPRIKNRSSRRMSPRHSGCCCSLVAG